MKKIRAVLGLVVVLLVVGFVFALKRQPGSGTLLPSLKPYVTRDTTMYIDYASLYKSSGGTSTLYSRLSKLQPIMMRITVVKGLDFKRLSELVHHDLTAKDHWNFPVIPGMGSGSSSSFAANMIAAFQGPLAKGTSSFLTSAGTFDMHEVTVMPDFAQDLATFKSIGSGNAPNPTEFMVMEQKPMSTFDVLLLRVKNLGKNPFSSEGDMMKAMTGTIITGMP